MDIHIEIEDHIDEDKNKNSRKWFHKKSIKDIKYEKHKDIIFSIRLSDEEIINNKFIFGTQ